MGLPPRVGTPIASPVAGEAPAPVQVDLQFVLGSRVAGVSITGYTGQVPAVAEVERLAEVLLAKLEAASATETPRLSVHSLRLQGAEASFDGYVRHDGVTVPLQGETADERQVRELLFGDAVDVYRTFHTANVRGADDLAVDVRVQHLVSRFAAAAAAAAFLGDVPNTLEMDPRFSDLAVDPAPPVLGDEAVAVSATFTAPDDTGSPVEFVVIRQGPLVSLISVRPPIGSPPPAVVETLAAAALECVRGEGWCLPVALPANLTPLTTPNPVMAPSGVEGVVIRQFVSDDADATGLVLLAFTVLTIDDEALATGDVPGINPFIGQFRSEHVRLFREFAPTAPVAMEIVTIDGIGEWSQGEFSDAAGDGLDIGLLTFGSGARMQVVLGVGHGDDVLEQLEAIAREWSALGEDVVATQPIRQTPHLICPGPTVYGRCYRSLGNWRRYLTASCSTGSGCMPPAPAFRSKGGPTHRTAITVGLIEAVRGV